MRIRGFAAIVTATVGIMPVVGCADADVDEDAAVPTSSSAQRIESTEFDGMTVGELRNALWGGSQRRNVGSFSTNAVTDLFLGIGTDFDSILVEDSFIVVSAFFCEPRQAYIYAVDDERTTGTSPSAEFIEWERAQAASPMCDGRRPARTVGAR
ncbi:hypothetical protein [Gordonia shandongensis]|uniref:hypothetical protein n=1 Tax=Gordonia shandongensis TaxID=376351 RepID=UPI000409D648|nr:hypothetical protein [Gordonia shandongensis]